MDKQVFSRISTASDLREACKIVHEVLGKQIDASNIFLVLYNSQDNTIQFPYFIDECTPGIPGNGHAIPMIRGSLTSLVIEKRKPLLLRKEDSMNFRRSVDAEPTGPICEIWAGVPVFIDDQVGAVLAVQSYSNPDQYSHKDLEFLSETAQMLAPVIARDNRFSLSQRSTNRFRKLIENLGDVIYSTDFHSRISYISPAISSLSGFLPSELLGKYRYDVSDPGESFAALLIHAEDRERVESAFKDALENRTSLATEYRILSKEGKVRWVLEKAQQITGPVGESGLEGIISDIHEQKNAEHLNTVLFEISNAINTTFDLGELFQKIHESLGRVINVCHFYISLYEGMQDTLTMPFNTDQIDCISVIKNVSQSASLTAEVVRTGKPLFLKKEDQKETVRRLGGEVVGSFSEAFICVPLVVRNKVIGAMATQSYSDPYLYGEKDVEVMLAVSEQVAVAIHRKQAEEQLKQREKLITTMYTISNAVHTTSGLQDLYKSIHRSLSHHIDARNFTIALYDRKTDTLNFDYTVDEMDYNHAAVVEHASRSSSVTQECIERGTVLLLDEEGQHDIVRKRGGQMIGPAAKSWLAVPLKGKEEILGAVLIQNYHECKVFKEQDVDLVNLVSGQIAIAIERKRKEAELKEVQHELIMKAHKSGMADIATDTLHNIGNVLNSIKISNEMIGENLSRSQLRNLSQSADLIRGHINALDDFIQNHPHGKKVLHYILELERALVSEQQSTRQYHQRLTEKIALMVDVIRAQQAYAGTNFMTEKMDLSDIVEDTLTLQSELLDKYGIQIIKHFEPIPKISIQKTKLAHVLINLISNARQAMSEKGDTEKQITLIIENDSDAVYLKIRDNGCGIRKGDLEKVFVHGYTTRSKGHGFGLHSSAIFMGEMGGRIWAESEGEGKGATFVLQFPKTPSDLQETADF